MYIQKISRDLQPNRSIQRSIVKKKVINNDCIFQRNAKNVSQLQAFVGTRLLALSGSSGSGSSGVSGGGHAAFAPVPAPLPRVLAPHGKQVFNPGGNYYKWLVHAHILFDNVHTLPNGIVNNNIGYGDQGLFTDVYSYKTIGHVMPDEDIAHLAVLGVGTAPNGFNIAGAAYTLSDHNCQAYASEVYKMYLNISPVVNSIMLRVTNLYTAYMAGQDIPLLNGLINLLNVDVNTLTGICVPVSNTHLSTLIGALKTRVRTSPLPVGTVPVTRILVANSLTNAENVL